jgi:hypothetical protein
MNTAHDFRLAMAANSTATSFTAKTGTSTDPAANTGYHNLFTRNLASNGRAPDYLHIQPFATAANDVTFSFRIWGWSKLNGSEKWEPVLLGQYACVAGNIAEGGTNTFLVDTITKTYGGDDPDIISPANDLAGSVMIHLRGHQLIEFDFSINSGTATAMNAYWRPVDRV